MKAFLAMLRARNREFLRDRGTMAWNFLFPFLAIFALAVAFSGTTRELYKVGVVGQAAGSEGAAARFLHTEHVGFVPVQDLPAALEKVRRHKLDMVLDLSGPPRYWVNGENPKGYFLERVLWGSAGNRGFAKEVLQGRPIRYVDWLLPGILAMNVMFSCLFGVGYVIVRYRKGGILRRLMATPISPFQFLSAQVVSRLWLVMFTSIVLFVGSDLVLDFYVVGSLLNLFLVFLLGAFCLISLSLVMATRTSSQELAGGLLNLFTWPMMLLSEVFFSLEGSPDWLIKFSKIFPLTHMVGAARRIMVDGAGLVDVWPELTVLAAMSAVFLAASAVLFRWE